MSRLSSVPPPFGPIVSFPRRVWEPSSKPGKWVSRPATLADQQRRIALANHLMANIPPSPLSE